MTRIGVLGGTFDPIHIAHLVAADTALHQCSLDLVQLVVANDPWQKSGLRTVSPAEVRFEAVSRAVEDLPGLAASRAEIDRGGPSYMADTLGELKELHPRAELVLIGGADAIAGLESWQRSEEIARLASIAWFARPGWAEPMLPAQWRVEKLDMPPMEVSSTALRRRLTEGQSVRFLVPSQALAVYSAAGLYA